MQVNWQKQKRLIFKAILFLICGYILPVLAADVFYAAFGDYLSGLTAEEIQNELNNPYHLISKTALHLYLVVYILFALLPPKIRKAPYWLRGIYFTAFYFLCCLIYIWI